MGAEATRAATVYRRLLKVMDRHIGKDGGKGHFRDYISHEFRKSSSLSDQEMAHQKLKLASDYTYVIDIEKEQIGPSTVTISVDVKNLKAISHYISHDSLVQHLSGLSGIN